jgi:hypothetical protein
MGFSQLTAPTRGCGLALGTESPRTIRSIDRPLFPRLNLSKGKNVGIRSVNRGKKRKGTPRVVEYDT